MVSSGWGSTPCRLSSSACSGHELLQHPAPGPSDQLADLADVGLFDEAGDAGGAVFVVDPALRDQGGAAGEGGDIHRGGVQLAVAAGRGLEIKGDVVDEPLGEERSRTFGASPLVSSLTSRPSDFSSCRKTGRSRSRVGSPPEMTTPSMKAWRSFKSSRSAGGG